MAKFHKKPNKSAPTTNQQEEQKNNQIFSSTTNKIADSLKEFNALSDEERKKYNTSLSAETLNSLTPEEKIDLNNPAFLEQFWEFFKKNHPNLLGEIESKDKLTIYTQHLEDKGFSLENLTDKRYATLLHEEIREKDPEDVAINKSLKELEEYCDEEIKTQNMPASIFSDFAQEAGFETTPKISIKKSGKIKKINDLHNLRTDFLEKNSIKLREQQKKQAESILTPNYIPAERILITATIKKLKTNFKNQDLVDFEDQFKLPITIHSPIKNLRVLATEFKSFLDSHNIDETTRKKIDKTIITNGDMYKELRREGIMIDPSKGFSDQQRDFRLIFNKLATRQIFEEAQERDTLIDKQIENIADSFKAFPPYINELFNIYPYDYDKISAIDPDFENKRNTSNKVINEIEIKIADEKTSAQEREELKKLRTKEKEKLNTIKRQGYTNYIKNLNNKLGSALQKLVDNKFNISLLSQEDQQEILNSLIKNKLEDTIKNKVPELLSIDKDDYEQFIQDLFDLSKKDIIIPSKEGPIPLHFKEKSFLGGPLEKMMEITNDGQILSELKNLSLNLRVEINEINKDLFERNPIFAGLFNDFDSAKGPIRLNDSYKVRIKNPNGSYAEGYLSPYPPTQEILEDKNLSYEEGKTPIWYLYSHPITRPEDERNPVTRKNAEGKETALPVIVNEHEETKYEVDILSKEINLNGDAIGGLLFGYTLGEYSKNNNISPKQEKELHKKFKTLDRNDIYLDTADKKDHKEETSSEQKEEEKKDPYQELLEERQALGGYQTKEEKNKDGNIINTCGFEKGASIMIEMDGVETSLPPIGTNQYMQMKIENINKDKGTFTVSCYGTEQKLDKFEGFTKELPLQKSSLINIKESFGDKIYKLPKESKDADFNKVREIIKSTSIDNLNTDISFENALRKDGKFTKALGQNQSAEVTHFGVIESAPGEAQDQESKIGYMYKIEHDPKNNKFTVSLETKEGQESPKLTLDYPGFILFIAGKKLVPKTEPETKQIFPETTKGTNVPEEKKRKTWSINNIVGFVKGITKKINDGIKKYDDEKTEELTDQMMGEGGFLAKVAGVIPSDKRKGALGGVSKEYMLGRDKRVWKKVENYYNYYTGDPDFGSDKMRGANIAPYLSGDKKLKNPQQAAAMLLATVEKGKGPYSRNTDRAGKGKWIKLLFGNAHQQRYFLMKQKLERQLAEGYKENEQGWADDLQNEILKLEMKYIVHSIDGRQLADRDDVARLESTYSKAFAGKLEESSNKFFKETNNYSKEKDYNFELARFEYFRLLGDRPQQAIPCLKALACKANTDSQWKVFEGAVLTGMLSGIFYSMTQEDKSFIQKICRTIGFLPGMWAKDPNHNAKVAKLLDVISNGNFSKEMEYDPQNFSFGNMPDMGSIKNFASYDKGFYEKRFNKNRNLVKGFVGLNGKNSEGKTMLEVYNDPKTSIDIKSILGELIGKSLERDESVDPEVKANGKGLQQNILAKNQSLIDEVIRFQDGQFRGNNKDEIQGMQYTWKAIKKEIPSKEISETECIYILKKFFNWFEDKGFNPEEKKTLIRLMLTVKKEKSVGNRETAKEMLRYNIVGTIVSKSGHGQVPKELLEGLESFYKFFETNLETIIKPSTIENGFGGEFVRELEEGPFKVAPWEKYVRMNEYRGVPLELSKDERTKRNKDKNAYNQEPYINKEIYSIARKLDDNNYGIPNRFKKYYNANKKKSTQEQIKDVLNPRSIYTKDPKISHKIKNILTNPNDISQEDLSDEELAEMEEMELEEMEEEGLF